MTPTKLPPPPRVPDPATLRVDLETVRFGFAQAVNVRETARPRRRTS